MQASTTIWLRTTIYRIFAPIRLPILFPAICDCVTFMPYVLPTSFAEFRVMANTYFAFIAKLLLAFRLMIAIATLLALVNQVSGTPYIPGVDSPSGTDCSGLAS